MIVGLALICHSAAQLALARQTEAQVHELARDIRTLTQWLRHDVLALAGPALAARRELFDLIVAEPTARKPGDARRIRPVRVALQNQRDTLLAFPGVLDGKLAGIAQTHAIAEPLVREACLLHRLPSTSPACWQGCNRLRATRSGKFHILFDAVSRARADTPRSNSPVETLNSRLRTCFTLRRHLGQSCLDLLRFLNRWRFTSSRRTERQGKGPRELMSRMAGIELGSRRDAFGCRQVRRGRHPRDMGISPPTPPRHPVIRPRPFGGAASAPDHRRPTLLASGQGTVQRRHTLSLAGR